MPPDAYSDLQMARAAFILNLRQHGVMDADLLRAFELVPHEIFVPEDYQEFAYREGSLPLGFGQSITSPFVVAQMLGALEPLGATKVLEVGTGSGYSAALLAKLARRVFTLERIGPLARQAAHHWRQAGISNIAGFHKDGFEGLESQAPFDRILITGAVEEVPELLVEQLAEGGVMVVPVGPASGRQILLRLEKFEDEVVTKEYGQLRLAPLIVGKARNP